MIDTELFDLLYNHLEERNVNNVHEQLSTDRDYQEALTKECVFYRKFEDLHLSEEQVKAVERLIDAIHAKDAAFSMIVFRMGMRCCFSLVMQLADMK